MATPYLLKQMGLITTSEAAATIGIHRNTIWNAIKQGHIPATKIGNAIALKPKDVAKFRERYLRGEVTTTSRTPQRKGRPIGSKGTKKKASKKVPKAPKAPKKEKVSAVAPKKRVKKVAAEPAQA